MKIPEKYKIGRKTLGLCTAVICMLAFLFYSNDKNVPESISPHEKILQSAKPNNEIQKSQVADIPPQPLRLDEIQDERSSFKLNLSALYTAEASFVSDYQRYSTDLVYMGWSPSSLMKFKVGFLKRFDPDELQGNDYNAEDPERMNTDQYLSEPAEEGAEPYQYSKSAESINLHDYAKYCRMGCTAGKKFFEVILVAQFEGNSFQDVWLINHKKEIRHVVDGVTGKEIIVK